MELTPSQKKTVMHQFDSFCKMVMKGVRRDYYRHLATLQKHEVMFSEMSEDELMQMFIKDVYPSEQFLFHAQEYAILIHDERLAFALQDLSEEQRDIILLSYFLDMTDQEIADKLNAVRRTVQYKRVRALEDMRIGLEGIADGNCNKEDE